MYTVPGLYCDIAMRHTKFRIANISFVLLLYKMIYWQRINIANIKSTNFFSQANPPNITPAKCANLAYLKLGKT